MLGFYPPPKVATLDQSIVRIDTCEYTYFATDQHEKDCQESDSSISTSHQFDLKQSALSNDVKWQTPYIGDTPNQPRNLSFTKSLFGGRKRSFRPSRFDRWAWLHYITSLDSAFCFVFIKSFNNGTVTFSKKETSFFCQKGSKLEKGC